MAELRVSELPTAVTLDDSDLLLLSQPDANSDTGYASAKTTNVALATKIAKNTSFGDLATTSKKLIGAINELKQLIALIPQFDIEVVEQLPTEDISETTIYMVPSQNPETENAYDEFIYVDDEWEQVGSTAVDLSAYYTKLEVNGLLDLEESKADMEEDVTEILEDLSDDVTVTGNPVTFETINGGMAKSCEVTMLPIQSGTGDPSPTNIRPISGWDGLSLTRTGVNQWDEVWESGSINNSTGQNQNAGTNRIRSKNYIPVFPQTSYYFYNSSGVNCFIYYYKADQTFIGMGPGSSGLANVAFTTPAECYFVRFRSNDDYGTTYGNNISVNYPSTDTAYHAYQGQTHTATFTDTVYGGKVVWKDGVVKAIIDRGYVDLDEIAFTYNSTNKWFSSSAISSLIENCTDGSIARIECSSYKKESRTYLANNLSDDYLIAINNSENILVRDLRYDNAQDFIDNVGHVDLVYYLKTPQEITLTPETIALLKGNNVLWTDGNEIKLTASELANIQDLLTYIQSLEARIKALEEA